MWRQTKALLSAYYRSKRNRWDAEQTFSTVIIGLGAVLAGLLSIAGAVGLFLMGLNIDDLDPIRRILGLDMIVAAYLFLWFAYFMMDVQQSDTFDLRKLLYLPVRLHTVVGLNYAASLISLPLIPYVICLIGLQGGLLASQGPVALLLAPLAAAFYLALGAFAYLVRGTITAMMQDKRKRHIILTALPLFGMVIGFAPMTISQLAKAGYLDAFSGMSDADAEFAIYLFNAVAPPFWLSYGIDGIVSGELGRWAADFAGLTGIAVVQLYLGYRGAVRFYTGAGKTRRGAAPADGEQTNAPPALPPALPFVDPDTAAMAYASFQTFKRHPQVRVAILGAMCMPFFILFPLMSLGEGNATFASHTLFGIFIVMPLFGMMAFMCNLFGTDRSGFQALILLPTPRYKYVAAKNIAIFPFTGGLAFALVLIASIVVRPGVVATLTALVLTLQAWAFVISLGNFLSIRFPYHIPESAMRNRRAKGFTFTALLANIVLFTITGGVVFLCLSLDGFARALFDYAGPSPGLIAAVLLLALTAFGYRAAVASAGRELQHYEQTLLDKLRKDRE